MVRVLFCASLLALFISAAFLFLPFSVSVAIAVVLGIAFILVLIFKRKNKFNNAFMLFICLVFSVYGIFSLLNVKNIEQLSGQTAIVEGYITEDAESYDTYCAYVLNTTRVEINGSTNGVPQRFKVRITESGDFAFSAFVNVKTELKFESIDNDYKNYSYSQKIYLSGSGAKVISVEEMPIKPIKYYPYLISKGINKLLYSNMSYSEAALSSAVLLGDESGLTESFYNNSKVTGVTHMLVVSGTHLSIITMALMNFLKRFKVPYMLKQGLMLFVVYLIMSVCGFSASILRAGLTYVIYFLGNMFFKKSDGLNALGTASVILLFESPFLFHNTGYLLSYWATFAVLYLTGKVHSVFSKIYFKGFLGFVYNEIVFILSQTISATFATMPICMLSFGYFSIISPIANLLLTAAVNTILSLSIFAVMLAAVPILNIFSFAFFFAITYLAKFTYFIVDGLGSVDFALISVKPIHYVVWILIFIAIFGYIGAQKIREYMHVYKYTVIALILVFTSALGIFTVNYFEPHKYTTLSMVNVGNGICAIVKYDDNTVLIGMGDNLSDHKRITNRLFRMGERDVDLLIVPTLTKDYAGGAVQTLENIKYQKIVSKRVGTYSAALNSAQNVTYFNKNISGSVGEINYKVDGFKTVITTPNGSIEFNNSGINTDSKCDILVGLNYTPLAFKGTAFICGSNINNYFDKDNFYYINKDKTITLGE